MYKKRYKRNNFPPKKLKKSITNAINSHLQTSEYAKFEFGVKNDYLAAEN